VVNPVGRAPEGAASAERPAGETKIRVEDLVVAYSDGTESLRGVNLAIPARAITVLFGPAGGGKSTLLRTINRLNDLADVVRASGHVWMDGEDILDRRMDTIALRRKVGMVFARPVVLRMTIRQNVLYGLELAGGHDKGTRAETVERGLRAAALWDEVRDRLDEPAIALSGGQQQRLCLARVLALEPEVILLDEPTSGLDPISTARVEVRYTLLLVPHSVQQAARVADQAAFLLGGQLIEFSPGREIFTRPKDRRTEEYVTGRFG
jgi:phosphate transport system ATP-binding protein